MALGDADGPRLTQASAVAEKTITQPSDLTSSGFRARLDGVSLFDLVQMECLARSRRVIRVASAGRVGYLFFRDGEIFHAATRHLAGERAAQEMLGWTDGTFEPCNIAWPDRPSIDVGWQSLILGAAKAMDEESAGKLVRLPNRRASSRDSDRPPPPARAEPARNVREGAVPPPPPEAPVKSHSQPPPPPSAAPAAAPAGGVQRAVRVDSSGRILSSAGDTAERAGFAAYASRVGELIGNALGL